MKDNKLVFGGFKSNESDSVETHNNEPTFKIEPLKKTYYANAKIFSPKSPRRWPRQVDKLSMNVFNEGEKQ